jgi:hypothetical protein
MPPQTDFSAENKKRKQISSGYLIKINASKSEFVQAWRGEVR